MPAICLLAVAVLLLMNGCAMPERKPVSSPVVLAERYLEESWRKHLPSETRIGLLLGAVHLSWNELRKGEASRRAREIYNASTANLVVLLSGSPGKWNTTTTIRGPGRNYSLSFAPENRRQGVWDPGYFNRILLLDPKEASLRAPAHPEGFGGVLVGIHKPEDPRKWLLPRIGVAAPVTAVLNLDESASPEMARVTLTLYDPTRRNRARVAHQERNLIADFGAPLGYYPDPWLLEYLALIDPGRYENQEGLYLIQPYDSRKIPVILVHGLMSIPQMWLPVIDEIERSPELRGKFQFWTFAYPTGDPVALSALRLRESLQRAYQIYPKTKDMVMVSYSLGGLVGKMQVQTTGETVWNAIFQRDAARLQAELPADSLAKRSLVFEANPRIKRIVFICTPHLGSPLAVGLLGQFGRSIISLPAQVVGVASRLGGSLAAIIRPGDFLPNSIWGLSTKAPLLLSLYPLPVQPPFHSIIGNRGRDNIPLRESSDGVVPYWSSHLPGAVSERIVPAQHVTACQNPDTINELQRILHLHLKTINH